MPGATKRKAPINLNASPARLVAALTRHPRIPTNVTSASASNIHATTLRNLEGESDDDEVDDDSQSGPFSVQDELLHTKATSDSTTQSPYNTTAHIQPFRSVNGQGTRLSPIPEQSSSPSIHDDVRGPSSDAPSRAGAPSPDTVFSPRNHFHPTGERPIIAYHRPPRTPNRPELYQPQSSGQRSPSASYPTDPGNPGSPVSNYPSQELQLSGSGSNSPSRNIFRTQIPPRHENIMQQMLSAIMPVLDNFNQMTLQRINGMEGTINFLAQELKKIREDGQAQNAKLRDVLKGGYTAQRGDTGNIERRVEDVANLIRSKSSLEDSQGLFDRLDRMSAALETVSERVDALKSAGTCIIIGASVLSENSYKTYTPAPVNIPEPELSTQINPKTFSDASTFYDVPMEALEVERMMRGPSPEPVVRVEAGTSPMIVQQYLDEAVETLAPEIDTEDIGIATESAVYMDVGTGRTPEPEPMEVEEAPVERLNAATSPIRNFYVDSSTMPRTPVPSPLRHTSGSALF